MGNSVKKVKHKKYVIYSSFIRKYTTSPLVDVNNSFELPGQCQVLYIKLGPKDEDKAVMKVLFMPTDASQSAEIKAAIESEWSRLLKLNEHPNIVHYLGREYPTDDTGHRRCEILAKHCPVEITHAKNASTLQMLLWGTQIGQALAHAHECDIFHGRVLPENIAIVGDAAVLTGFEFCKFTRVRWLDKLVPQKGIFSPPEKIVEIEKSNQLLYWMRKYDTYKPPMNFVKYW